MRIRHDNPRGLKMVGRQLQSAFTMVELALCIAVVGIAMVSIIGVLPLGINVQKQNRDETIINQDAQIWMDAIQGGNVGFNDLANYVDLIQVVSTSGSPLNVQTNTYLGTYWSLSLKNFALPEFALSGVQGATSPSNIIGLISTPKFTVYRGRNLTNVTLAVVRAMSGSANEKPNRTAQDTNGPKLDLAFKYLMTTAITPYVATPRNTNWVHGLSKESIGTYEQLQNNLYTLSLTFEWPVFVVNNQIRTGSGRKTFRTHVSSALVAHPEFRLPSWQSNPYYFSPNQFTSVR